LHKKTSHNKNNRKNKNSNPAENKQKSSAKSKQIRPEIQTKKKRQKKTKIQKCKGPAAGLTHLQITALDAKLWQTAEFAMLTIQNDYCYVTFVDCINPPLNEKRFNQHI